MKDGNLLNNLAKSRTVLANERTFLAYVRTAIMLAVSGVTLIKLLGDEVFFLILGMALGPAALAGIIFGFFRFKAMCKRIKITTGQDADNASDPDECMF